MKTFYYGLVVGLACIATSAFGATRELDTTVYITVVKPPEKIALANNQTVNANGQTRATLIDDKTGETSSQWCNFEDRIDGAGIPIDAGYCTVYYDNGDVSWYSYVTAGADHVNWTVMGGTGKYAGATGSGTGTVVSRRSDGASFTIESKGTLVTK